MEFRVLGVLEHVPEGSSASDGALGGPKQRAVLAILLKEAGNPVTAESIITGVWGEDAQASLKGSLHTYISNLRIVLGGRIERVGNGYRLEIDPSHVDAHLFAEASESARSKLASNPAEAADELRSALALWRGRPYADLMDIPGLQDEIRRLEDLRLATVEARIDADLAIGRHGPAAAELATLVAQYPFREGLRARQMLALYRDGRQAEALRAYSHTRSQLLDELGVDPSPELQDLEERILRHDPGLLHDDSTHTEEVAFLFTDIEASTSLWETMPQVMRDKLAHHDQIVAEAIERSGGNLFKHTGDGVLASFGNVREAAEAASAIQRSLAATDWGELGELPVRMALDLGEVDVRGGDYFGPPLNRGVRLMNAAHGGQIVMSGAASDVVRSEPGVQVRSLGEHRFAGLGAPQPVYQLVVDGIPQEFPELRIGGTASREDRRFGDAIKGYELRERIGSGRFGIVYRAYQPSVGREVAIKVIRPEYANHPIFVRRFESEARLVAKLSHPHIVPLFDFWRDSDGAYLVMPYLSGRSFGDSRYGALSAVRVGEVIAQVGSALSYAHRHGVIHRDVKPANVLTDDDGNAYLGDFGIAVRGVLEAVDPAAASDGLRPAEETTGDIDERTDVFGLAVTAAQLLTGSADLNSSLASLPSGLRNVIERGFAAQPGVRQSSADAFVSDLLSAIGGSARSAQTTEFLRNPFKGLAAFEEADSADFYGRSDEIDRLRSLVATERFVTVVGPSGSGKSSLVRAGLIPALRAGGVLGVREPLIVTSVPGAYPFDELATGLSGVSTRPLGDLAAELQADTHGLLRVCKQLSGDHDAEVVLVIDQFEELYTLVLDEDSRRAFVENLVSAATDPRSRVRIVATIRADFFDRPLSDDVLGPIVSDAHLALSAPSPEQLVEAIEGPAAASGLQLEAGLSDSIVADVSGEPGTLPLLQFLMTDLVDRSDDGTVTWQSYHEAGRIAGALARRAEDVHESLPASDQEVAGEVFLRLVTVSDGADDVRRRVRQSELEALGLDRGAVARVLERFGAARLLTFDRDPVTRGTTVEVAHEALLREWPRFRGWVEERRGWLIAKRRFDVAVNEWLDAGRSTDFLPVGGTLAQFEHWAATPGTALTAGERSFLVAAVAERDDQRRARTRRRRRIMASLTAAAVVSMVLAGYAWVQASLSSAREIVAEAEANLELDPELSILLAMESARRFDRFGDVPPRVTDVLRSAMANNHVVGRVDGAVSLGAADDGSVIVTVSSDGTAEVRDPSTLDIVGDFSTEAGAIFAVLPSTTADEMFFVVQSGAGYDVFSWTVGEPVLGERVSVETQEILDTWWYAVSPDGRYTAESPHAQLIVRERSTGTVTYTDDSPVAEFSFASDGRLGYLKNRPDGPSLMIVDPATGEVLDEIHAADGVPLDAQFVSFDPAGRRVAVGSQNELALFDLQAGALLWLRDDIGRVFRPRWRSDDAILVGGEGDLRLIDSGTGGVGERLLGHRGGTWYYAPIDGTGLVASVGLDDGQLVVHEIDGTSMGTVASVEIPIKSPLSSITVDADGRAFLHDHESAALIDPDDPGATRHEPGGVVNATPDAWTFPISSDNAVFYAYIEDGRSRMWSAVADHMVYEAPEETSIRGISDDGTEVVLAGNGVVTWVRLDDPAGAFAIDAGQLGANVVFTPDHLITSTQLTEFSGPTPNVNVWERETLEHVLGFGSDETSAWMIALSPDGRRIATTSADGTIFLYDLAAMLAGASEEDALELIIDAHNAFIPAIDFSADGSMIASTAWNEPARVWDVETGEPLGSMGSNGPAIGFHPEKPWLYVGESGRLTVHSLDSSELLDRAAMSVTRDLTPAECERYLHRACRR